MSMMIFRRHGNGPVDASTAPLERFDSEERTARSIQRGGELQRIADPASCGMRGMAERSHRPERGSGRLEKDLTLLGCKVNPPSLAVGQVFALRACE